MHYKIKYLFEIKSKFFGSELRTFLAIFAHLYRFCRNEYFFGNLRFFKKLIILRNLRILQILKDFTDIFDFKGSIRKGIYF